jgi:ribosomal protein S27E
MFKQRAQTTKAYKSSPCTYANSPWTSANPGHKSVRLVPKTGQTGSTKTGQTGSPNRLGRFHTADHTAKMQKKCTSSPLTLGIGSRNAMQPFSAFLSPPCCQCMNQGSNLKICNLELLQFTKFITRCYKCPNEQVRYSTAS